MLLLHVVVTCCSVVSQCVTCCVGFCCTLLNWGTGRNGIFLAVEGLALRCNCMTSQQTLVDQTMQTHWRIPYATNNVSSSQPLAQELETHAGRIGHAGLVLFGFPSDWNKLTCRQRFQQVSASAPHEPLLIHSNPAFSWPSGASGITMDCKQSDNHSFRKPRASTPDSFFKSTPKPIEEDQFGAQANGFSSSIRLRVCSKILVLECRSSSSLGEKIFPISSSDDSFEKSGAGRLKDFTAAARKSPSGPAWSISIPCIPSECCTRYADAWYAHSTAATR